MTLPLVCSLAVQMCITAFVTARYNSRHNAPNHSTRIRVRYLLFMSVWTVVFGSFYLVMFLVAMDSIFVSVASHFFLWVMGCHSFMYMISNSFQTASYSHGYYGLGHQPLSRPASAVLLIAVLRLTLYIVGNSMLSKVLHG